MFIAMHTDAVHTLQELIKASEWYNILHENSFLFIQHRTTDFSTKAIKKHKHTMLVIGMEYYSRAESFPQL